jgi:hypothetical protein
VIESPESVSRVAPPTVIIANTRPATKNSQRRTARSHAAARAGAVSPFIVPIVVMRFFSLILPGCDRALASLDQCDDQALDRLLPSCVKARNILVISEAL